MATSYLATVKYGDADNAINTAISGKVMVKFGDVTCNAVDVPSLEARLVPAVPGSARHDGYSLTINDTGDNYKDMVTLAVAGTIKYWQFARGPGTSGERTCTFQAFITSVRGPSGDLDTNNVFEVTLKPIGAVTFGTVSS